MDDALKKLGYDSQLRKVNSIAARPRGYISALDDNIKHDPGPYAPETVIQKGVVQTTGGGVYQIYDNTGGTLLFGFDPSTGILTINGAVVANISFNIGTLIGTTVNADLITGGTFAGVFAGTSNNNILGSPLITGGTWNNGVFGTPAITGGTYNSGVLGTPLLTGGTYNQAILGSPTITGGTFTNKITVGTGANQSIGRGTLTAGVATVVTTAVTTSSIIFLTPNSSGVNLGIFSVGTINAGTNFVVNSSNIADGDSFNWWFVN
jgi:hypothetical protein